MIGLPVFITVTLSLLATIFFLAGIRIVRPTHRGLVERLGGYRRFALPGFNWIIPIIDKMYRVNITEMMVNAEPQEIVTSDSLNARVDAQVYFRVKDDEQSVKNAVYGVSDYRFQIANLARTTLRRIIGTLSLKSANGEREKVSNELQRMLVCETCHWGIDIVRTQLMEINPSKDVQETINKIHRAKSENTAAMDFAAAATEAMADGARRAECTRAEGAKQANILVAEGEAQAIKLIGEAANRYAVENAQLLKRLEALEKSRVHVAKIAVPVNSRVAEIIGELPRVPLGHFGSPRGHGNRAELDPRDVGA